jgi:hypothetical protein
MTSDVSESGEAYLLWIEFEEAKRRATRKPDLIQELLADLEMRGPESRPVDIDSYITDRAHVTRQRVSEVRAELATRLDLNTKFMAEIDAQINYLQLSLEQFAGWGVGYNTGVDVKRNHLERQLQQLRTERRGAELRTWDDLVKVRKELREAMKEYRDSDRLVRGVQG